VPCAQAGAEFSEIAPGSGRGDCAGFVGRHVVDALLARGEAARAFDLPRFACRDRY
jgi:hypothetical protein